MTTEEAKSTLKDILLSDLVSAVKQAANGTWSLDESEESSCQSALMFAMSGGLPIWFTQALEATKTIMQLNEMQGLECLAALHFSTRRASEEQKLSAIRQIIQAISSVSPNGLGILPFGNAFRGI